MAETEPTPSEIERAREIAVCTCPYRPPHMTTKGLHYSNCPTELIDDIAQALATAREQERERCAKIINAQEGMQGWKHRILSTIRRGEP